LGSQAANTSRLGAGPHHQHLGMGGGIFVFQDAVAVPRQQRSIGGQQHRTHRHFTAVGGRFRFFQRQCYGFAVFHGTRS
jgi:hypothetical protein